MIISHLFNTLKVPSRIAQLTGTSGFLRKILKLRKEISGFVQCFRHFAPYTVFKDVLDNKLDNASYVDKYGGELSRQLCSMWVVILQKKL